MWRTIGIAIIGMAVPAQLQAAEVSAATTAEAIVSGTPILNLRPRYENVDQSQPGLQTGEAYTLRSLVGWKTGSWNTLSGTIELIDVGRLNDDYNDGQNGKAQYPVIADPDNTDINQLYLDWNGLPSTNVRAGRQSIKLDNVRFVGNVEFRQVMQVFNGVTVENTSLPNTRLYAGYLGRLKTINTRQHQTDTVLLNARYALAPTGALTGYGYFQDQWNAIPAAGFSGPAPTDTSNRILGLRADGAHPLNEPWKLLYTAEYAKQDDYAGGDPRIDAHYLRLGAGARRNDYALRIDREVLSSNDGLYAFQTPLGTNHLFQGWADQFLVTPRQGIRDTFVSGSAKIEKFQIVAEYHWLKSDIDGIDFGNEFDIGVTYPLMPKLLGRVEYADYRAGDAGSGKVDTRKVWLTLMFNY
ncbi:MAG TPA: alginate export family protein [Burkholderiales bacterium]|nr:alginate export family protein [Burkholderiales bacterium]